MPRTPRLQLSAPWRASVLSAAICAALVAAPARAQSPTPAAPVAEATEPPAPAPTSDRGLQVLSVDVRNISGEPIADARKVLNQVRTQPGQPYSPDLLNVDLKTIAAMDLFVTIEARVERVRDDPTGAVRGVSVTFVVRERALVNGVQIAGNRAFKDEQIRGGLTVHPGSAVDSFAIDQDRKFILDKYHKGGFAAGVGGCGPGRRAAAGDRQVPDYRGAQDAHFRGED